MTRELFILLHNFTFSPGRKCSLWRADLSFSVGFSHVILQCSKPPYLAKQDFPRHGEFWSSKHGLWNHFSPSCSPFLCYGELSLSHSLWWALVRAGWWHSVTTSRYGDGFRCGELVFAPLLSFLSLIPVLFTLFLHNWVK